MKYEYFSYFEKNVISLTYDGSYFCGKKIPPVVSHPSQVCLMRSVHRALVLSHATLVLLQGWCVKSSDPRALGIHTVPKEVIPGQVNG